jgi:hypothetical protein
MKFTSWSRVGLAAVALGLVPSAGLAATPAQILQAAHRIEAVRRIDRFATAPAAPEPGDAFSVSLALYDGDRLGQPPTSAYWSFKDGELSFHLWPSPVFPDGYGSREIGVFYFSAVKTAGKPYVGENAYGARRTVTVENWVVDGLAVVSAPLGRDYTMSIKVDGPEARRLAGAARFVIEGRTVPLAPGKPWQCQRRQAPPKADYPVDDTTEECWTGATITRVALIDSGTNAVLNEWIDSTAPAAGRGQ